MNVHPEFFERMRTLLSVAVIDAEDSYLYALLTDNVEGQPNARMAYSRWQFMEKSYLELFPNV